MVGGMRRLDLPLLSVLACGFSSALLLGTWVLDDAGISMAYGPETTKKGFHGCLMELYSFAEIDFGV